MNEKELLNQLFDELFPLMRSITGPGIEESMQMFNKHMPLSISKVPSGTKVYDWTVPPEWHFRQAKLIAPDGHIVCDASVNNLHVVNYSEPIDKEMTLEELEPYLHSIPELPSAIPYITSYYKRKWGFCLSHNKRKKLKPGKYRAIIDAEFVDGGVPFAQCLLQGESPKEILLTSYLCHPSLANNELSGPLALLGLFNRIKSWDKRRYSYRFLINPETIGSLCFLHDHAEELKQNIVSGLTLTCLGGPAENLKYKSSRLKDSLVNQVFLYENKTTSLPIEVVPFTPLGGSDERQFCAPGFNFPMGQISRTTYGEYDGYHNSLDTKDFMKIDNVIESIDTIEQILKYIEICGNPVNLKPFGEPQLGTRNLYPNMNSHETRSNSEDNYIDGRTQLNRTLLMLNMADGETSLIDIAKKAGCSVDDLIPTLSNLEREELIRYNVKMAKV
jgi:aminopeptidase-like protein